MQKEAFRRDRVEYEEVDLSRHPERWPEVQEHRYPPRPSWQRSEERG
ncbi:MAG: hypothetical protein HY678_12125 [Chloroflexi bacterium]|nr:hypothetical protein [Chloroflexota bacterium]